MITPSAAAVTEEQAAAEMLRRRRARASLMEYARSVDIPGTPLNGDPDTEVFKPIETSMALHHQLILKYAQICIETYMGRLMIFAPPGSAKSSYISVVTPAWCLSKWDQYPIIGASYQVELMKKHSRKTRALCRDPRHVAIWPGRPTLSKDQAAAENWALSNGSSFMAAGFQTGITGSRARGLIIDDPVKNRDEADSPVIQVKTIEEYRDSARSRLAPGGWVIMIQTRWNENDLAGSILPEDYKGESGPIKCQDGLTWMVLNIPAKCEMKDDPLGRQIGEYLWTDWFPESHWKMFEDDPKGQRTWASLYQQRPTAGEGIEFKREWFQWYDPDILPGDPGGIPRFLNNYGASDYASKEDRKLDFTEHGVVGISDLGDWWIKDWWFGQKNADVTVPQFAMMAKRNRALRWAHEGGPIGNALSPAMLVALRAVSYFPQIEVLTSIQNKALKLASFQGIAANGLVHLPLKRPWATRLVDQLCSFPAGRYDDGADVCGLLGRLVDKISNAHVPSERKRPQLVPFTKEWLEWTGDQEGNRIRFK